MSGGVDSSVAAALLIRQGRDVVGVTMDVGIEACRPVARDARRIAELLGIPHRIVDVAPVFSREVVDYFCAEYARGRTPNPCVACNYSVKLGHLLDRVLADGCAALATGHYARVERAGSGRLLLKRGLDPDKDQSYMLHRLRQRQLERLILPLGAMRKGSVRDIALEMGLPAADRDESQEICFLGGRDYRDFLRRAAPEAMRPGPIVDLDGNVIGEHRGIAAYTVGQRRGTALSAGRPLYVVDVRPSDNTVVVGPEDALYVRRVALRDVNYLPFDVPPGELEVTAKVRYASPEAPATLHPSRDDPARATLLFDEPRRAVAPGQSAVFYSGDVVVGGGTIESAGD